MADQPVNVSARPDGSLIIRPRAPLAADDAAELRRALVHAVRRIRPPRLILDLHAVPELDSIIVGVLVAACHLGDDHRVSVFVDHPSATLAGQLSAAGVAARCLRHVEHPAHQTM